MSKENKSLREARIGKTRRTGLKMSELQQKILRTIKEQRPVLYAELKKTDQINFALDLAEAEIFSRELKFRAKFTKQLGTASKQLGRRKMQNYQITGRVQAEIERFIHDFVFNRLSLKLDHGLSDD